MTPEHLTVVPTKRRSFWVELVVMLVIAGLLTFGIRLFLVQTFYIPSESMEQTLLVNDRVLTNKAVYDFRDPRRGEVVVFVPTDAWRTDPTQNDFIKRVIGTGGDHVVCDPSSHLSVNGKRLTEPYVYPGDPQCTVPFDVKVPQGRLFVMGDHRSDSWDSSKHLDDHFGTIAVDSVVGRAFMIFWPIKRTSTLSVPSTFDAIPDNQNP